MRNVGNSWGLHWRQLVVDVLIGVATLAVAFAALGATSDVPYVLLIAGALVGIGLMLESSATAQPTGDIGPQPLRVPPNLDLLDPARG